MLLATDKTMNPSILGDLASKNVEIRNNNLNVFRSLCYFLGKSIKTLDYCFVQRSN